MSARVLIVDDSLTVRMDLAEAFEAAGFDTRVSGSIAEARRVLQSEAVDVAVLDVLLPDGDGVEFLAELRASGSSGDLGAHAAGANAHMSVLMLSAEAEVKDRVRALQVGADEYVGKPYEHGYVVAKARELLRARRHAGGSEGQCVLVIDDSETYREALRRVFTAAGYAVLVAPSGEEGLRVAADRRPAAIIVDGVLPGIDGATVVRRVRLDAALSGTACLLLTASEDTGAELRALDAGADAFVRKEEEVEVILAKLTAALRRSALPTASGAVSLAGPRKILAVDDSPTYAQRLVEELRGEGYDVISARSGEEALDLLAVQPVDCVLLDLVMPGLGGTETCRRIKAAPIVREIPLIMLTSCEDRAAMLEGLGAGADDYISKSSELEVLKARVRAQLRRKQFEDEHRKVRDELLRSELAASQAKSAKQIAEARVAHAEELERKNKELEAFSYSVSHDLRAPLRSIDGFSQALLEECAGALGERGRDYLHRVCAATQRMSELIDDLLALSRVSRAELNRDRVDLSEIARVVADGLRAKDPGREVTLSIQEALSAQADGRLLRVLFENLLGNAWKFTSKTRHARIVVEALKPPDARKSDTVFVVRDNGAGFDMAYAERLFSPFRRLHDEREFPGSGIGLATVYRIVDRHGGRVWAEGAVGQGASLFFTLPPLAR